MDSHTSIGADLIDPPFAGMSLADVCALASRLQTRVRHIESLNAKLTHEMAVLKRLKFAATSERFSAEQKSLLEEAIDEDLEALAREVEKLQTTAKKPVDKHTPKRQALPSDLPRRDVHHKPENTTCLTPGCGCQLKRIGEAVSEKLYYLPGSFAVERHVRGRWGCAKCQTLIQAPVPAAVIDKGIATASLMAHVVVCKYIDNQPLFHMETNMGRSRVSVPCATQAEWVGAIGMQLMSLSHAMCEDLLGKQWLHADEMPVAMLKPGLGKTHRAYLSNYCTTVWDDINAVVFDFDESEAGHNARRFLGIGEDGVGGWRGTLICDDYAGYKQAINAGVTEVGCLSHARRKFHEL